MGDYDNLEETNLRAASPKPSRKRYLAAKKYWSHALEMMHKRPKWKHQLRGHRQHQKTKRWE